MQVTFNTYTEMQYYKNDKETYTYSLQLHQQR